jgi:hypothetical protein
VARLGSLQTAGSSFTVWMQVRGSSWVEAKEGRFRLRQGEWIAFEKESRPLVQAGRNGLCVGLNLNVEALRVLTEMADCGLYAGRGRMNRSDARVALRLWRDALASGQPAQACVRCCCTWLACSVAWPTTCSAARAARAAASARCSAACSVRASIWKATATGWCASANWPS